MKRLWIALAVLVFALGGGELLAKKPGGGGDEPAPDPAIAYEMGDDLYVMNDDGSNVTLLLAAGDAGGSIRHPTWSPDGTQLAFMVNENSGAGLYTLDVAVDSDGVSGSGLTYLTAMADSGVTDVSWSPVAVYGVERIAFRGEDESGAHHLYLVNADGTGGRVNLERGAGYGVSWSPTGDRIAVGRGSPGLRVHTLALDASDDVYVSESRLYDLGKSVYHPAWSKTQDDVLVVSVANPSWTDLWEIDLADAVSTSDPEVFELNDYVSLTSTSNRDDLYASWSPDDTKIVWRQAGRGVTDGLHVLQVDGSADPELLLEDGKKTNKAFRPEWRR
jgi:Tol biopolymer transport system component